MNIAFNASDKNLAAVLLLIDNNLKDDALWTWNNNVTVEAVGSYNWDTTNINSGSHKITILAFDEHGANNSPATSTITVSKAYPRVFQGLTPAPNTSPSQTSQQPQTPQTDSTPQTDNQPGNQPETPPITKPQDNPTEPPRLTQRFQIQVFQWSMFMEQWLQ